MAAKDEQRQGHRPEAGSEGSVEQRRDPTDRNRIRGLPGRTSGPMIAKSTAIEDRGGQSGGLHGDPAMTASNPFPRAAVHPEPREDRPLTSRVSLHNRTREFGGFTPTPSFVNKRRSSNIAHNEYCRNRLELALQRTFRGGSSASHRRRGQVHRSPASGNLSAAGAAPWPHCITANDDRYAAMRRCHPLSFSN